jgi:hypothetical protein
MDATDNARLQAQAQLDSIKEMVAAYNCDYDRLEELRDIEELDAEEQKELAALEDAAGDCEDQDDAAQRIQDNPLSVEIRTGWYTPGSEPAAEEFRILLCTGGPAVQIRGELNQYNEPERAWLEYQDWGTPWTEFFTMGEDNEALLEYCRQFYLGGV